MILNRQYHQSRCKSKTKQRELVSDDAKKVRRNGQRSGIVITSDGSGFSPCRIRRAQKTEDGSKSINR